MARKEPQATPSENNSAGSVSIVSDDQRSLANVIALEIEISKKPPTTLKATCVRNIALTEGQKRGDWRTGRLAARVLEICEFKPCDSAIDPPAVGDALHSGDGALGAGHADDLARRNARNGFQQQVPLLLEWCPPASTAVAARFRLRSDLGRSVWRHRVDASSIAHRYRPRRGGSFSG